MATQWTRRQVLAQVGIAAAAIHTLDPHELCCAPPAHAATHEKDLFELKKVGDGVYAAVAAPAYKVNSNATVIVTNDGVVVVDSHSKPSAARAVYQQIQAVTKQPVRKIVNTHFHWDHWQGNEVYAGGGQSIEVVASERTKENLTRPDANNGGVAFISKQIAALPAEIQKLRDEASRASDPQTKERIQSNLRQAEAYLDELKQLKPALPTRTVSSTETISAGGRDIQLHVLGRAHTDGDLFILLPKEKVVVTGDALIDWMPFLNDGYPEDWVRTLDALERLDFTHIVPGHGDVLPKSHLSFFRGYLSDLIAGVKKAASDGATLDEIKAKLPDQLAPKYERGMSKYPLGQFRDRIALNIEMAYNKVVKKV
jgi:glyoxylase-like metal-dependent hydrolase (beta-lactamase superfamily II)